MGGAIEETTCVWIFFPSHEAVHMPLCTHIFYYFNITLDWQKILLNTICSRPQLKSTSVHLIFFEHGENTNQIIEIIYLGLPCLKVQFNFNNVPSITITISWVLLKSQVRLWVINNYILSSCFPFSLSSLSCSLIFKLVPLAESNLQICFLYDNYIFNFDLDCSFITINSLPSIYTIGLNLF